MSEQLLIKIKLNCGFLKNIVEILNYSFPHCNLDIINSLMYSELEKSIDESLIKMQQQTISEYEKKIENLIIFDEQIYFNYNQKINHIKNELMFMNDELKKMKKRLEEMKFIYNTKKKNGVIVNYTNETISVIYFLDAIKFEYFYSTESQVCICVDTNKFIKLLNIFNEQESITLYIKYNNPKYLCINNVDATLEISMNLMEYSENRIILPKTWFDIRIILDIEDLMKICKYLGNFSETIKIMSNNCESVFCNETGEISLSCKNTIADIIDVNVSDFKGGIFNLKDLKVIEYCKKLSNTVTLFLQNNNPLIVKLDVKFGFMYFVFTPS